MPAREPGKIRKVLLAGGIAVVLTGAGAAAVWAASESPGPAPSPTVSAMETGKAQGHAKIHPDKGQREQQLHSESVVKKSDGTFETKVTQRGTVESVSDSAITVKSEDGFSQSYTINADTRIVKIPAPAADGTPAKGEDGKRLKPAEVTAAELKEGDSVRIAGVKAGSEVTAQHIVEGALTAGPGMGLGRGLGSDRGQGLGHGKGLGLGHEKPRGPKA